MVCAAPAPTRVGRYRRKRDIGLRFTARGRRMCIRGQRPCWIVVANAVGRLGVVIVQPPNRPGVIHGMAGIPAMNPGRTYHRALSLDKSGTTVLLRAIGAGESGLQRRNPAVSRMKPRMVIRVIIREPRWSRKQHSGPPPSARKPSWCDRCSSSGRVSSPTARRVNCRLLYMG